MTSFQRKIRPKLAALGYEYVRHVGPEAIFQHPEAGFVRIHGSPSDNRAEANYLALAKRKIRLAESNGQRFADYLCRHHKIPRDGEKEVAVPMNRAAEQFILDGGAETLSSVGDRRPSAHAMVQAAVKAERIEVVYRGHGANAKSRWLVRGRLWTPGDVEADSVVGKRTEEPEKKERRVEEHLPPPAPVTPVILGGNGHDTHAALVLSEDDSALLRRVLNGAGRVDERHELLALALADAEAAVGALVQRQRETDVAVEQLRLRIAEAKEYHAETRVLVADREEQG